VQRGRCAVYDNRYSVRIALSCGCTGPAAIRLCSAVRQVLESNAELASPMGNLVFRRTLAPFLL
jgi:hypothetical protein